MLHSRFVDSVAAAPAPSAATSSGTGYMRSGAPTAIAIPAIGVSAPIEPVWLAPTASAALSPDAGGDSSGADAASTSEDRVALAGATIGLPSSADAVGWYALGALPGSAGSALLVGHVDTVSAPAVFGRLSRVHPGDLIEVTVGDGDAAVFAVDGLSRYPAATLAPDALFALSGPPRLYLVTCTGRFVRSAGGYQERLIVAASRA